MMNRAIVTVPLALSLLSPCRRAKGRLRLYRPSTSLRSALGARAATALPLPCA